MVESPEFAKKTDSELVELTLENQDNFLYIVNRYETKLLHFIRRISNVSLDEARDLLQEVFIKVYQNLNDFNPSLKFSSWIYRITRNHVISHYRKNKNKPILLAAEINEEALNNLSSEFDIDKKIDQQILKQSIDGILNQMDNRYKEVIVLKYFEEKNYQEISDIIKKPTGTVATYLNRGKKQFKEKFK
ncbi:MAG: RNA polymerase sigma factor [Patescibacteria group bacterium]|jgi:RNA polymerase sigma-70 factor (ECF subfamily)